MMLRAQRAAAVLRTFDCAHHYSQHAFIRDDKSAKDLLNIADQDQPFPNFSWDKFHASRARLV